VQDFRFLCPNGTAFDQEAQICADWGDVDCEAATLYYGSDNFDLYRLGSGFESKRAPYAEEDEAEFHLQRAETSMAFLSTARRNNPTDSLLSFSPPGDARRSKQYIVNQSTKPQQPPFYHQNFNQIQQHSHRPVQHRTEPITTTTTTARTTTTSTTTAAPPTTYRPKQNYNIQTQPTTIRRHFEEPKSTTPAYKPFSTSRKDFSYTTHDDYSKGKLG
jgi:hypothetical protein